MGGEGEGLGESHPVVEELAVSLNILRSSQLNIVDVLLTHLTCGLDTNLVITIFRSIVDSVKIFVFTVRNVNTNLRSQASLLLACASCDH